LIGPWGRSEARFPHTGTLLGYAVADELEGSEFAVESLRQWMTDATRFPAGWIAAVESTLAKARVQARRTAASTAKQPLNPMNKKPVDPAKIKILVVDYDEAVARVPSWYVAAMSPWNFAAATVPSRSGKLPNLKWGL
jgi:hypothetical protein